MIKIDVSNCMYFDGNYCPNHDTKCDFVDKCYFREYKRKERECEELKKEIINKNEKIKELRFSVSDLTNRLCYLNAEKSFRIVDLEQTLKEIEEEMEWVVNNRECYDLRDADRCERILDIINKAKDGE